MKIDWGKLRKETQVGSVLLVLPRVIDGVEAQWFWMTEGNVKLGFRSPLVAIARGDVGEVLALLEEIEARQDIRQQACEIASLYSRPTLM